MNIYNLCFRAKIRKKKYNLVDYTPILLYQSTINSRTCLYDSIIHQCSRLSRIARNACLWCSKPGSDITRNVQLQKMASGLNFEILE